jgi:hypothetical protein
MDRPFRSRRRRCLNGDPAHRAELRHADTTAFIASDRAGAMTATVVNLSAGSITD